MTGARASFIDQSSGTTDKGAITSSSNNDERLTTLDSRGRIASVVLLFVDSKGFASNRRLIDLEEGIFGNDAAIGRNDCSLTKVRKKLLKMQ